VILGKERLEIEYNKEKLFTAAPLLQNYFAANDDAKSIRVIILPEFDPKPFATFLVWLEVQDLDASADLTDLKDAERDGKEARKSSVESRWTDLGHCCLLAERLKAWPFHNVVMDELVALAKVYWEEFELCINSSMAELRGAYSEARGTLLGKMLLDLILAKAELEIFTESMSLDDHPGEFFIMDFLKLSLPFTRNRPSPLAPWEKDACIYHVKCTYKSEVTVKEEVEE